MSLTTCPECGKNNVSDTAETCPQCGYSIKSHFDRIKADAEKEEQKKRAEEAYKIQQEKLKAQREKKLAEIDDPPIMELAYPITMGIAAILGSFVALAVAVGVNGLESFGLIGVLVAIFYFFKSIVLIYGEI